MTYDENRKAGIGCGTCAFFTAGKPEAAGTLGLCRRFPPRSLWEDPQTLARFPLVASGAWCGEHQPANLTPDTPIGETR